MSAALQEEAAARADLRDRLVAQYRYYVLKVARSVAESLPVHVEIDDLVGDGQIGLIEAAARFDPERGASFRTFAHARIRGAIFDGIRRDLGPNLVVPVDALEPMTRNAALRDVFVADAGYARRGGGREALRGRRHAYHRAAAGPQDHQVWLSEVRERLERAVATLTPIERAVIHQRYVAGREAAAPLRARYSKSWLSRVHSRALAKLRARLLAEAAGKEAFL